MSNSIKRKSKAILHFWLFFFCVLFSAAAFNSSASILVLRCAQCKRLSAKPFKLDVWDLWKTFLLARKERLFWGANSFWCENACFRFKVVHRTAHSKALAGWWCTETHWMPGTVYAPVRLLVHAVRLAWCGNANQWAARLVMRPVNSVFTQITASECFQTVRNQTFRIKTICDGEFGEYHSGLNSRLKSGR